MPSVHLAYCIRWFILGRWFEWDRRNQGTIKIPPAPKLWVSSIAQNYVNFSLIRRRHNIRWFILGRWDRINRGPVSQQVWHDKDPPPAPKLYVSYIALNFVKSEIFSAGRITTNKHSINICHSFWTRSISISCAELSFVSHILLALRGTMVKNFGLNWNVTIQSQH